MTVILHVEDDISLSALITLSFEGLGFRGETITATTVEAGEKILDDAARDGHTFDLIISDMNLPDGTGLDVVRHVRASPAWKTTPMLILSGDLNPKKVGRAYALGANAYVDKSPRGRSLDQVVTALYQHWMNDVVVARRAGPDHVQEALARAIEIRLRHAQLYQRLADRFAANRSEAAFWLSRALGESNLVNVLVFVQSQVANDEVASDVIGDIAQMQGAIEVALTELERELDGRALSRDEMYQRILLLLSIPDIEVVSRSMGRLFPVIPVAVATLRDFLLGSIQDVSAWIDLHTGVPAIRAQAVQLRDTAMTFRSGTAGDLEVCRA
jgi:CheY-like chemotaxis protein